MIKKYFTLFLFFLLIGAFTVPMVHAQQKEANTEKTNGYVYVLMSTSMGDMVLELDSIHAPITVKNFLGYVDSGFYDSTIFHRVIKDFVVQGGGFTDKMVRKTTGPGIQNEWQNGLKNVRGSISMARMGNQPNSATTQFFLNTRDNKALDIPRDGAGYAVFGKIVKGLGVLDEIRAVKTHIVNDRRDVPVEPVYLLKAKRVAKPKVIEEDKKAPDEK